MATTRKSSSRKTTARKKTSPASKATASAAQIKRAASASVHGIMQKCFAEGLAVFSLTLAVSLSAAANLPEFFPATPFVAALVLGAFVYTVGPISGAHVNPAVTIGLLGVGKIRGDDALRYIVAQVLGAIVALVLIALLSQSSIELYGFEETYLNPWVGLAELIGTFFLVFGVSSVANGKIHAGAHGLVVGGSLLVGILVAVAIASDGVLNPAVSLGLGLISPVYIVCQIVGGLLGAFTYSWLVRK